MRKILMLLILLFSGFIYTTILINDYIVLSTKARIITIEEAQKINDVDCIIVLGAGIRKNKPSPLLEARLITGLELYNKKISNKIIMSGDHATNNYDEVTVMEEYMLEKGIPSKNLYLDNAGISTYDSLYRLREIFKAKKVIIVTQEYHLPRALYIAEKLGVESYGVASGGNNLSGQNYRDVREFLARNKDFIKAIIKPQSKYLEEVLIHHLIKHHYDFHILLQHLFYQYYLIFYQLLHRYILLVYLVLTVSM